MTEMITLVVTGEDRIRCAGCEQRIGKALRRLPGVLRVAASATSQRVVVTIDPAQVGIEEVRAKLEQVGYQALPEGGAR